MDDDEILDKRRAGSPSTIWQAYGQIEDIIFDPYLDYTPGLVVVTEKL